MNIGFLCAAFDDYHEIEGFAESLNANCEKEVKFEELEPGFFPNYPCLQYVGLFYQGRRPSQKKIEGRLNKLQYSRTLT